MERILRFRNRNFDNVYYPLSRLKGISRDATNLVFNFESLNKNGDSATDTVKIKFTDAGVHPLAVSNFYKAVYGSKTTIITIIDVSSVEDNGTVARNLHAFGVDNDDGDFSQFFDTSSITNFVVITLAT